MKYMDMMTDGQSGAGGFVRVFDDADDDFMEDVEVPEELEDGEHLEELLAFLEQACRSRGVTHIHDGSLGEGIMTLEEWLKKVQG